MCLDIIHTIISSIALLISLASVVRMSVSDVLFNSEPLLAVNMVFGLVTVCISLYQILVASLLLWQALKTKGNIFLCSLWYVSHLSILTLYFIIFCARAAVCFKERRYLAGTATVVVGVIYEDNNVRKDKAFELPHLFIVLDTTQRAIWCSLSDLEQLQTNTCSKCGVRRKCLKWFTVHKFPQVLVLHLKRFSPTERFRGKLNVLVEFPLTGLDMAPYAAVRAQPVYNLYAVSNHSGTTYSGHYTAYCKHPYTGDWHEYNDSRVTPINQRNVVSSEAYVLFYELARNSA
ncbi:ubiquitin carboxyl-terminal hydrolase 8-like [Ostrinia furnacalis]|uniref:ubiquitin carboxyl-terminal hydrolase 8-like n=1 Tax=Ostrinia furnacalis TaxID=93504 RepID=UPI001039D764|nr:ubiquitin carboxyl-terminal hydrolase 8-like [Ostrinia furnacalis]